MAAEGVKVVVTGGSGFLGSWCVKLLLEKGYTVHTTVRSAEKASFLQKIDGASSRLKVFVGVDLLKPGAFDEAMEGCEVVFHTASPFFHGGTEELLVTPALEGTRNVLTSCTKQGVKKVVLTSSIAAVMVNYGTLPKDTVYTGEHWSPEDILRKNENWYDLSKTVAERLAWEMSKEQGCPWQLTAMNPCLIFGPMLDGQTTLNTSQNICLSYFDGSVKTIKDGYLPLVDVRDVAEAHVAALTSEGAWGQRFILIGEIAHRRDIVEAIRATVPEELKANVPTEEEPKPEPPYADLWDAEPPQKVLGLKLRTVKEMVADTASQLLANGFKSTSQYTTVAAGK